LFDLASICKPCRTIRTIEEALKSGSVENQKLIRKD